MPRQAGTGCITCRIRRVKCDEAKPHCKRCASSKRQCDGYLATSSTITRRQLAAAARELSSLGPVAQTLSQYPGYVSGSSGPGPGPETVPLFDFFRYATAPATVAYFPSDFWTVGLLQLAHAEPAIWHAAIALAALHRRWEVDEQDYALPMHKTRGELTRQALEHQVSAMSHAKGLNDPFKTLVLSLALVAISNIMGRWTEARLHFTAAMRLLRSARGGHATPAATEMLSRLDVQTMTFVDSSAPYPYATAEWLTQVDRTWQAAASIDSYGQAATTLFAMFRRALLFDEALCGMLPDDMSGPREHELRRDLCAWERKMADFESRNRSVRIEAATAIRLYHTMVRLLLAVTAEGPEVRWDRHLGHFERILACVEILVSASRDYQSRTPFSLELGLVTPLYLVGARCRHPVLRRRAVARLQALRSQEGVWNSDAAAAVVKELIRVEDETAEYVHGPANDGLVLSVDQAMSVPWEVWGMGNLVLPSQTGWEDVPCLEEERRVREMLPLVNLDERTVHMRMVLSMPGPDYYNKITETTVCF